MEFNTFKTKYNEVCKNSRSQNINREFFAEMPVELQIKDKELSTSELYAIWYMVENGFSVIVKTCNTAKTELLVTKNGISDTFTLTAAKQNPKTCDIQAYMMQFSKSFAMLEEITKLKAALAK